MEEVLESIPVASLKYFSHPSVILQLPINTFNMNPSNTEKGKAEANQIEVSSATEKHLTATKLKRMK